MGLGCGWGQGRKAEWVLDVVGGRATMWNGSWLWLGAGPQCGMGLGCGWGHGHNVEWVLAVVGGMAIMWNGSWLWLGAGNAMWNGSWMMLGGRDIGSNVMGPALL